MPEILSGMPPRPVPQDAAGAQGLGTAVRRALALALGAITVVTALRLASTEPGAPFWYLRLPAITAYCVVLLIFFRLCWKCLDELGRKPSLVIILILALASRLAWFGTVRNEQVSDFAIYQELASSLASGQGYAITGPVGVEDLELYIGAGHGLPYTTACRAPGVPLWGALLYKIFGPHPRAFLVSNLIFGAGTAMLIFLLFELFWERLGRRAAFLWSIYPSAIMATNLYGTEIMSAFFLVLIALVLSAYPGQARSKSPLLGLLVAGAALIRSFLVPLIAAVSVAIWLDSGLKRGISRVLLFLVFVAVGLSPWTVRNWSVFHRFIPVCTMEGMFLGLHTTKDVPLARQDSQWQVDFARWWGLDDEGEKAAGGYRIAAANLRRMLLGGPLHVAACLFRNIQAVFADDQDILRWSIKRSYLRSQHPGPESAVGVFGIQQLRNIATAFHFLIVLGALVGALRMGPVYRGYSPGLVFLALFFLAFFAAHAVFMGVQRYQSAVQPFLMILAAWGYDGLFARLWQRCPASIRGTVEYLCQRARRGH